VHPSGAPASLGHPQHPAPFCRGASTLLAGISTWDLDGCRNPGWSPFSPSLHPTAACFSHITGKRESPQLPGIGSRSSRHVPHPSSQAFLSPCLAFPWTHLCPCYFFCLEFSSCPPQRASHISYATRRALGLHTRKDGCRGVVHVPFWPRPWNTVLCSQE
jgi:hypothetical protein